ncbi:ZIP family metal transporter [Exiguobacterium sp. s146]|uniref:ZIP family metal transporter n=1 Tax=Exiguobacterium sp. s146 TaxID=2751223 RepID=UPI001BEAB419|nr:ZIP family metal transporter [Exiguobacterium sp. s146]
MWEWVAELSPAMQALLGTMFTWGMTALGATVVFMTKSMNERLMDSMLGFAGGVMIAASFWSLLAPAIEMAEQDAMPAWLPATVGFLAGGLFLAVVDKLIPHVHPTPSLKEVEGIRPQKRKRSTLLVLAITLHNIPEGLAVGVAFGAVAADFPSASLTGAIALAIGIGIQNFPEGAAVALPLRRDGFSRRKSFFYGQLSGMVEPMAALVGVWAVLVMEPLLPYALSFAAGAMIFVVVEEVILGSQENGHKDMASMALMLGFTIMMMLDVALG